MKEKFHTFTKPGNIFNTSEQFFDNFASAKDNKGTFTGVNPYEYLVTKDPTNTETNIENTVGARNAYTNLLNSIIIPVKSALKLEHDEIGFDNSIYDMYVTSGDTNGQLTFTFNY